MPIYRRLPKRGFTKPNALSFNEVNLGRLQSAIDAGRLDAAMPVDAASLLAAGLIGKPRDGVRLLGKGVLTSRIAITVNHASRSATEAVEKAGGTVSLVPPKRPAKGGERGGRRGQGLKRLRLSVRLPIFSGSRPPEGKR